MAIERIDTDLCQGCGTCVDTCWLDVIRMDEEKKKAYIKYPEDCRMCALCELFCPQHAIYVSPTRGLAISI
jgi:NAD-dependent dihydropyrimidine dehydrogenase PreA subunit